MKILVPATGTEDWRRLLMDPKKHWKQGYSAKALADSWQSAPAMPASIRVLFDTSGYFPEFEPLLAAPEHQVPLPGGNQPSRNDVWVLARWQAGLISIAVEGKVAENFGPTLAEWNGEASSGKQVRQAFLLQKLGLQVPPAATIRYQLLHRPASALIEAERYHARRAVMLVHSFSPSNDGFSDYAAFLELFGATAIRESLVPARPRADGIELFFGWVNDKVPQDPSGA